MQKKIDTPPDISSLLDSTLRFTSLNVTLGGKDGDPFADSDSSASNSSVQTDCDSSDYETDSSSDAVDEASDSDSSSSDIPW